MYAIFEDGSHQYRVREGDQLVLDRRPGPRGEDVVFPNVLLIAGEAGATIGTPLIAGARVVGQIVEQFRDRKIIVQKFRRRKNMRRRRGHRQMQTRIRITGVHSSD
jgi:large subunit ribosomal protein L21